MLQRLGGFPPGKRASEAGTQVDRRGHGLRRPGYDSPVGAHMSIDGLSTNADRAAPERVGRSVANPAADLRLDAPGAPANAGASRVPHSGSAPHAAVFRIGELANLPLRP